MNKLLTFVKWEEFNPVYGQQVILKFGDYWEIGIIKTDYIDIGWNSLYFNKCIDQIEWISEFEIN